MEKSKQEKELEDVCSAEFLRRLKILGEHNMRSAIRLAGYDDGFCTGYSKGYDVGYEEGCLDTEEKLARKMLKAGLSMRTVKKCTSLSEKEIVALL